MKIYAWAQYNRGLYRRGLPYMPFPIGDLTPDEIIKYGTILSNVTTTPKPIDRQNYPINNPNYPKIFRDDRDEQIRQDDGLRHAINFIGNRLLHYPSVSGETTSTSTSAPATEIKDYVERKRDSTALLEETGSLDETEMSDPKRQKLDMVDTTASTGLGSASSGGFGQDQGPMIYVDRPIMGGGSGTLSFKQVHRFTSKGVAITPINDINATTLNMCTPLAYIPWDRAFMYLSPRDFASLPPGCFAQSVDIDIIMRNPQIGFNTGETNTDIATLNHNKHLLTAKGLDDKLYGINKELVFGTQTEPMKPTAVADIDYAEMAERMYGVPQTNVNFDKTVPASLFGVDMDIKNYYVMQTYNNAYAINVANTDLNNPGWQNFIAHVEETNMNAKIGHSVMSSSHKFVNAPLTAQLPSIHNQLVNGIDIQNSCVSNIRNSYKVTNTGLKTTDNATVVETPNTITGNAYNIATYTSLLENGDRNCRINSHPSVVNHQPSLHIGMKPIPKISSAFNELGPTLWTTVNAFFEISCTMNIGYGTPNQWCHGVGYNIKEGDIRLGTGLAKPNITHRLGRDQVTTV